MTPDISWQKEAEPYDYYRHKQARLICLTDFDFKKAGDQIPRYRSAEGARD